MKILIVSATESEVAPLRSHYNQVNNNIDFLVTGVGPVFTAFHLATYLRLARYDLAVNAGIAGSFDAEIKIGETVQIEKDCFGDFGAEDADQFIPAGDLGFFNPHAFPFKNGWLHADFAVPHLPKVTGTTVNTVHGNERSIQKIKARLNPQVESMEGAAFFYGCLSSNVRCCQIRTISNYVEKRDRSKWRIPAAIKNLNAALLSVIDGTSLTL